MPKVYKIKKWNQIKSIKSIEVSEKDMSKEGFLEFIDSLRLSCIQHDGIGLAAAQVGIFKRVMICNFAKSNIESDYEVIINPSFSFISEEKETETEYCLSVGTGWPIQRWAKIKVDYITYREGKFVPIQTILEGFPARLFQHEFDHLNGISIPQRYEIQSKK